MNRPTPGVLLPFALCAAAGVFTLLLPPYNNNLVYLVVAVVLLLFTGWLAHLVTRRTEPSPLDLAPSIAFFAFLLVLRDGSGGANSGLAPLVALPVLWIALFGTRRHLAIAAALTAVTFIGPVVVLGEPDYPLSDWRRGALWFLIAALIGPVVQRVVRRWVDQTAEVHASSARLDAVVRGAELPAIIGTSRDGTIEIFNSGAEWMLGYRSDEVVGRSTLTLFLDPEELGAVAAELSIDPGFEVLVAAARSGSAESRDWTFIRKDGDRLTARMVVSALRGQEGVLTGFMGIARDVTAAVEADNRIRDAEQRWRTLLDRLPGTTVAVLDRDLRFTEVTGAGAEQAGLANARGRSLTDVASPANAELIATATTLAFTGEEGTAELSPSHDGGEHVMVVTPLGTPDERREVLMVTRDVSADRAQQRQLEAEQRRFQQLFVESPHGILVLELDGTVRDANAALTTLLDVRVEDMIGRPSRALPGGRGKHTAAGWVRRILDTPGGQEERQSVVTRGDGAEVHVVTHSVVLLDTDGSPDALLVHVVDVSERHNYEQQLAHLAEHDSLTGLANRRVFNRALDDHLAVCRRYGTTGSVMLLDLDNFKQVNDLLGHAAGDKLIVSLARALKDRLRDTDLIARLGGDEFAVLLPHADHEATSKVAADLVSLVREHVRLLTGPHRAITVSIGAVPIVDAKVTAEELISRADLTMYDAKESGRDGFVLLDGDFDGPRTGSWLVWADRIARALREDRFVLHAQPVADLRTGRITGAEMLIRMVDENGELVPPTRFLYIAERAGLIGDLDIWALRHGVEFLARVNRIDPDFKVEVNLSGLTVGHQPYEHALQEALDRSGADPSRLVLEVTETAAVQSIDAARAFAQRLSAIGCRFALDDFGAGFGSYYYLKHLLFDYVKIDGEFVANCSRNETDRVILSSIVGIAKGLGKETIAEFVVDAATLEVVTQLGVDYAQGYEIGRPVPVEALLERLGAAPALHPELGAVQA